MEELNFKDKKVRYDVQGEGPAVFLLHGYLESLEIWEEFAGELTGEYKVIRMDLPGHGKSEVIDDVHSMELLAEAAKHVLDAAGADQCTLVGHSLGGYVTLAFLDLYPGRLNGFALFHSHPFADKEQVREKRQSEIDLVRQGRQKEIFDVNVPRLFADDNLQAFSPQVEWVRGIAEATPGEGIIANLRGMMQRPDRSGLVANTTKPFRMIAGKKDKYIDYETVVPRIPIPENGRLITLENSGHLGFIEEKARSVKIFRNFLTEAGNRG
jgi:pimeloyl-ACP methyl ester carboxylesterase